MLLTTGLVGTHMEHVYDFYKPDLTSEYPIVDGHFSVACYIHALDKAYQYYNAKYEKQIKLVKDTANGITNGFKSETEGINRFAYVAFHAPTCKVVQKSYARLLYNDYLISPSKEEFSHLDESVTSVDYDQSFTNKTIEKVFMGLTKERFNERVYPGTFASRLVGNMYTASVFSSLASILTEIPSHKLMGQRVGVFSYGSGLASSFYSVRIVEDTSSFSTSMNLKQRLDQRHKVGPQDYDEVFLLNIFTNISC
jgi:hydroxymethylglutaryl-CoA synthase